MKSLDDDSIAVAESAGSEPGAEWTPPDEEALHQITMAVAKLLAEGEGKEEIVRGLVRLNAWPEDSAVGFVNRIQLEIRTGRVERVYGVHRRSPFVKDDYTPRSQRSARDARQIFQKALAQGALGAALLAVAVWYLAVVAGLVDPLTIPSSDGSGSVWIFPGEDAAQRYVGAYFLGMGGLYGAYLIFRVTIVALAVASSSDDSL